MAAKKKTAKSKTSKPKPGSARPTQSKTGENAMAKNSMMGYLPNDIPKIGQIVLLGFQHALTMFPATVLVALLVGFHVSGIISIALAAILVFDTTASFAAKPWDLVIKAQFEESQIEAGDKPVIYGSVTDQAE